MSACFRSHRWVALYWSRHFAGWLTHKSCANEMKPRGASADHLQGQTETTGNWGWNYYCFWGVKESQHGCLGGGSKITNSLINMTLMLIKISSWALEKLILTDSSPVFDTCLWLDAVHNGIIVDVKKKTYCTCYDPLESKVIPDLHLQVTPKPACPRRISQQNIK